jgi:outer membrane protein assembly factor BamA
LGLRLNIMYLDDGGQGSTLDPDNRDEIFQTGVVLTYDGLDVWTNPREGLRLAARAVKTGGFLPGEGDWWTFILDGRQYFRVSERNTLLVSGFFEYQNGELGVDIPEYMQFDFGGANSIRGWSSKSRFGKSQLISTTEWLFTPVEPKYFSLFGKLNGYMGLQAALFGDVGLLWNDSEGFTSDEVIGGVGISIRPLLPFISFLRFDFAYGEPGEGISFFLGAGNKLNKHQNRKR